MMNVTALVNLATPIPNKTGTEGVLFISIVPAGTFTDLDGEELVLTATLTDGKPLPAWLNFLPDTGVFVGIPTDGDTGPISVKVTATDQALAQSFSTFVIDIVNVNDAPAAT